MTDINDELLARAQEYAARLDLGVGERLGFGVHGSVFLTNRQSAIKIHERDSAYVRERDIYKRLGQHNVTKIRGCTVPILLSHDDELWGIEMSTVTPPFVLDFAGAYLDRQPDFSDDVLAQWRTDKEEQFGSDWPEVELVVASFERVGIYISDVTPNNIRVRPAPRRDRT